MPRGYAGLQTENGGIVVERIGLRIGRGGRLRAAEGRIERITRVDVGRLIVSHRLRGVRRGSELLGTLRELGRARRCVPRFRGAPRKPGIYLAGNAASGMLRARLRLLAEGAPVIHGARHSRGASGVLVQFLGRGPALELIVEAEARQNGQGVEEGRRNLEPGPMRILHPEDVALFSLNNLFRHDVHKPDPLLAAESKPEGDALGVDRVPKVLVCEQRRRANEKREERTDDYPRYRVILLAPDRDGDHDYPEKEHSGAGPQNQLRHPDPLRMPPVAVDFPRAPLNRPIGDVLCKAPG